MLKYPKYNIYEFVLEQSITDSEKTKLVNYLIQEHRNNLVRSPSYKVNGNYNFIVIKHLEIFDKLYYKFLEICKQIFGNISLTINNNDICYANVSSIDDGENVVHNHYSTCTINGVYYLKIPCSKSGEIIFYKDNEILKHQPIENSLLIFPNTLDHKPTRCNSTNYRIALNMEIRCKENVWNLNQPP